MLIDGMAARVKKKKGLLSAIAKHLKSLKRK